MLYPRSYWAYCDKYTGELVPSRLDGRLYLMTQRPTKYQCQAYGYQKDKMVTVRRVFLAFYDDPNFKDGGPLTV